MIRNKYLVLSFVILTFVQGVKSYNDATQKSANQNTNIVTTDKTTLNDSILNYILNTDSINNESQDTLTNNNSDNLVTPDIEDTPNHEKKITAQYDNSNIAQLDSISQEKEKRIAECDSIIRKFLCNQLEEPFNKHRINNCIRKVDDVNEEDRSEYFNIRYKYYMPLMKDYEKYNNQLVAIIDRVIEIFQNNVIVQPSDEKRKKALNKLYAMFGNGQISKRQGDKPFPFDYLKLYNDRESYPSIYYLNDRIDEVKKALNGYRYFLTRRGTLEEQMDAQATLGALNDARKLLPSAYEKKTTTNNTEIANNQCDTVQIEPRPNLKESIVNNDSVVNNEAINQKQIQRIAEDSISRINGEFISNNNKSGQISTIDRVRNAKSIINSGSEDDSSVQVDMKSQETTKGMSPNKKVAKDPSNQNIKDSQGSVTDLINQYKDKIESLDSQRREYQKNINYYREEIKKLGDEIDKLRDQIAHLENNKRKLVGGNNPMRK